MTFLQKEKIFSKQWIVSYLLIVLGSFIMAVGFVFFITPHKIVPGGVFGISIVMHYILGTPVGLIALLLNIPLTIIGIKLLGPRFGVKTVIGFFLCSSFMDLLTYLWGYKPLVADDILLSCVFGGVLIGFGLGLIFKSKATSGGSDILALIAAKYTRLPIGQLIIYIDSVIVLIGLVAFRDWRIPLYSWIVIFITGKVVDVVLQGIDYDKSIFIISEKHEEIRDKIINELNRGGTFLDGKGMYNGKERTIIFTVVSRRELQILQSYISKVDPKAFLTVINASEILGEGFKPINE